MWVLKCSALVVVDAVEYCRLKHFASLNGHPLNRFRAACVVTSMWSLPTCNSCIRLYKEMERLLIEFTWNDLWVGICQIAELLSVFIRCWTGMDRFMLLDMIGHWKISQKTCRGKSLQTMVTQPLEPFTFAAPHIKCMPTRST